MTFQRMIQLAVDAATFAGAPAVALAVILILAVIAMFKASPQAFLSASTWDALRQFPWRHHGPE